MSKILPVFALFVLMSQVTGCAESGMVKVSRKGEVEVAPGKWLPVSRVATVPQADLKPAKNPHQLSTLDAIKQFADHVAPSAPSKERYRLEFDWNGKTVKWEGKEEIPITLRDHDGMLYMVAFNREESAQGKCHLVFLKLGSEGTSFEAIAPRDFPRQIATQNMWLHPRFRFIKIYDSIADREHVVDEWQMLRTLDNNSPAFDRSLTAKMWYQIETGTELDLMTDVDQKFLEDYVAKYKPIALPTIIKEPPAQATTNTVSNVTTNK